jgi:hypothetical protein
MFDLVRLFMNNLARSRVNRVRLHPSNNLQVNKKNFMKPSPYPALKVVAVFGAMVVLLGCKPASISAGEGAPALHPIETAAAQPDLVTITDLASEPPFAELAELEPAKLSARLKELIELAQSGVGDEVLLAYIQNSPEPFDLVPEEILYLADIGFSDLLITALIHHRGTSATLVELSPELPAATSPVTDAPADPVVAYHPEPRIVYGTQPVVQHVTPAPLVQYSHFYTSLAPYGSWIEVADYGWCWQPTVAVIHQGWRPYSDRGRWLYTNHGWYWQSDYSWGWAPFHYGRWFHHPARGWCWRPGAVWGPAWVSWRYTDSYFGWAPLPPGAHYVSGAGFTYYGARVGVSFGFGLRQDCWTFVPARRFFDRDLGRHRVHSTQTIYRNSTVVNNIIIGNNNTIINEGIGRDRVASITRSEIRKVSVRDLPETHRGVRPDRLHKEGSELVVYRPRTSFAPQPQDGPRGEPNASARRVASRAPGNSQTEHASQQPSARQSSAFPAHGPSQARQEIIKNETAATGAYQTRGLERALPARSVAERPETTANMRESRNPSRVAPEVTAAAPARAESQRGVPRPVLNQPAAIETRPSAAVPRTQPASRLDAPSTQAGRQELAKPPSPAPNPSTTAGPPFTPQTFRTATSPTPPSSGASSRTWSQVGQAPSASSPSSLPTARVETSERPIPRQPPTQASPAPSAPRVANWGAAQATPTPAMPQPAAPVVQNFRHEVAKPSSAVAAPTSPSPAFQPRVAPSRAVPQSAPSPQSFSVPAQRSYSAPQATQPARPSVSMPASRPAPPATVSSQPSTAPSSRPPPQGAPPRSWTQ